MRAPAASACNGTLASHSTFALAKPGGTGIARAAGTPSAARAVASNGRSRRMRRDFESKVDRQAEVTAMRLATGGIMHESNTFIDAPTMLDDFERDVATSGSTSAMMSDS